MKPLSICLVSKEYPPTGTGGISSYVYRLAHGLAEVGHNVTVIAGPADSNRPDRPTGPGNQDQERDEALPTAHQPSAVKLSRVSNREFWLPAPVRRKGRGIWNTLERSLAVDREIARLERTQGPLDVVEMPNWGAEGLCYSLNPRAPLVIRLSTPLAQVSFSKGNDQPDWVFAWPVFWRPFPPAAAPASLPIANLSPGTVPNYIGFRTPNILDTPWNFCSAHSAIEEDNG